MYQADGRELKGETMIAIANTQGCQSGGCLEVTSPNIDEMTDNGSCFDSCNLLVLNIQPINTVKGTSRSS